MKSRSRVRFLAVLIALTISLFIQSYNVKATTNPIFTVSPNVHYGLPAYDTELAFNNWITCDGWSWNGFYNATEITFTNLVLDSETISSMSFNTQISNMTVTALNPHGWINYTVTGDGTQQVETAYPSMMFVDSVQRNYGDKWTYSGDTITVTGATSTVAMYYTYIGPETEDVAWYFRSDTHTVNGVTGYIISESQSNSATSTVDSITGDYTVYWGWRIWKVKSDNSTTELTSGAPAATVYRGVDGEGLQTSEWTPDIVDLHVGFDAIKMVLYTKFASGTWTPQAIFVSDRLIQKKVNNVAWQFQLYTKREYTGGNTYGTVYWGDSTYESGVPDPEFTAPLPWELMMYRLQTGNLIGFIILPYTNLIGNLFYGCIILLVCVPIYVRHKTFTPILVIFTIFGGAGGMFSLLVPGAGLTFAWIFMLLGLGGLLYRLFR